MAVIGCQDPNTTGQEQVAKPAANPAGGNHTTAQTVTLTTTTTGADIYYTLNGTTPTTSSTKYSSPINISTTTTLKAIAVKTGMTNSDILTATYTITSSGQVVQPSATPAGGNYTTAQTVTLTTTTTGADIYYTLNGITPTTSSTKYSSPINISTTTTLKAIAVKTGMTNSTEMTETYTIGYTVTFYAGGGTPAPTSPVTVNPGSTVTQPSAMTKNWHIFAGWYTDSDRTIPAIFPITVTANVNLYARWVGNTFTNITDVSSYLASLSANTVDTPASLTVNFNLGIMTEAASGWQQLLNAVNTAGKFVNLDLSACTMNGTSFNPDSSVAIGKDRIVSLILPVGALSISEGTGSNSPFNSFSNLKSVSGAYVTTIGNFAFDNSTLSTVTLQSADFPRVTNIGSNAFSACYSLQTINFPQVTIIGNSAFSNCTSLQTINFPQVTIIGNSAFSNCTSLQSISFPASAEVGKRDFYANANPFDGCTSLTSFALSGSGNLSVIENGKALVRNGTALFAYPSASGSVSLNTITSIDDKAFSGCTSLQTVDLPQVTNIGSIGDGVSFTSDVFYSCRMLQSLNIPKIMNIGSGVFSFTGNNILTITMGPVAPTLGDKIFIGVSSYSAKTVIVKVPAGATGYSPASSPFTESTVTVSGTDKTANWGNGFRGGSWNGTTWDPYFFFGGESSVNQYVSLIIEQQ